MTYALFYDTETSSLPIWEKPSEHPDQPHIVQLAARLVDLESRDTISSIDVIIKPDGWTIPDDIAEIHGITTEKAHDLGVPESTALDMFMQLWGQRERIAHNESFDARIVRIAQHRFNRNESEIDAWKSGQIQCTARLATPIVKCPPTPKMIAAGRKHHKTANLCEAYAFFTGNQLANAHSAMVDVQACMTVYFAIQDLRQKEAA